METSLRMIEAHRLERGMVLMSSPECSIGVVERVASSMGWLHVELLDGGAERYSPDDEVLVSDNLSPGEEI